MRTLWLQNCLELAERGQVPASSFNPWPTSLRSHMCISTACCPAPSGLVWSPYQPPRPSLLASYQTSMISCSWSVLAVWTFGSIRGLPGVEAISGLQHNLSSPPCVLPLHPSISLSLYRCDVFFSTLACRQFCAVFTRVSQPVRNGLSSGERRLLENHTHTHTRAKALALAYPLPRQGPLELCCDGGPLQPPPTKSRVVVGWSAEQTIGRTVRHPSIHPPRAEYSGRQK